MLYLELSKQFIKVMYVCFAYGFQWGEFFYSCIYYICAYQGRNLHVGALNSWDSNSRPVKLKIMRGSK